jgi:hypothetical protein
MLSVPYFIIMLSVVISNVVSRNDAISNDVISYYSTTFSYQISTIFQNTKTILDKKYSLFPDFQFLLIIQIIFQLSILNSVATINNYMHDYIVILSFLHHIFELSDIMLSVILRSVVLFNAVRCNYAESLFTLYYLPTFNSKISTLKKIQNRFETKKILYIQFLLIIQIIFQLSILNSVAH